jgi:hypothetical protein
MITLQLLSLAALLAMWLPIVARRSGYKAGYEHGWAARKFAERRDSKEITYPPHNGG